MIPPKAPASTTLRNARTYALRDGSPAGTSESPGSPGLPGSSPPPLLVGSSSISRIVRRSTARQPCACHTDHMAETVREWLVAGALVESDGRLLFVRNQRRGGSEDWSTPGGVIDADDGSLLDGLTREVEEETGLRVTRWEGPRHGARRLRGDAYGPQWRRPRLTSPSSMSTSTRSTRRSNSSPIRRCGAGRSSSAGSGGGESSPPPATRRASTASIRPCPWAVP